MRKSDRIDALLWQHGLRSIVNAMDQNRDGEVVLWINGNGIPVRTNREALTIALAERNRRDAEAERELSQRVEAADASRGDHDRD